MRIILIGFGVVGSSFVKLLSERLPELVAAYGLRPKLVAVVDIDGALIDKRGLDLRRVVSMKQRRLPVSQDREFGNPGLKPLEVMEEAEAEVVVEATPTNIDDGEPGLTHIKAALRSRKHVITTNKGPLALALPALIELSRYNGVVLAFSGTVGGGTPILDFAKRCLLGDNIISFRGILNGTTNYILTRMAHERMTFDNALKEAQRAGYAETDPSMDIDGYDAACKLVILANWCMNRRITLQDVKIKGIRAVALEDVAKAAKRGSEIKLIASTVNGLQVNPQAIPTIHPLCIGGALNAVTFTSKYAGEQTIVGKGAGGVETASAVIRDLIKIRQTL